MKIALLGAEAESLELVRWAVERGGHQLVAAYDSESYFGPLQYLAPALRLGESWEELVLGSLADAVVIGRGDKALAARAGIDFAERRADQLRKLTQAAIPLIVVCPACEAIVGFEIEMIRRDAKGIIIPYVPNGTHPMIGQLSEWMLQNDESPIGQVEQVSLEREQRDRSRDAVLVRLARDASLVREFTGNIQSVSASGPAAAIGRDPLGPKLKDLPSLANLSVHFTGDERVSARWSIGPALAEDLGRLTLIGSRGKATLCMPSSGDWSLQLAGEPAITEPADEADDMQQIFAWLAGAVETHEFYDQESWLSACRDQEAAEAVDRSLSRGRTIELFNEEHTEAESFKGVMAMGGCLLLLGSLGVLLVAAIVEALQLPIRSWPLWRLWPVYLLAPIGLFLLLQLLRWVVKEEPGSKAG